MQIKHRKPSLVIPQLNLPLTRIFWESPLSTTAESHIVRLSSTFMITKNNWKRSVASSEDYFPSIFLISTTKLGNGRWAKLIKLSKNIDTLPCFTKKLDINSSIFSIRSSSKRNGKLSLAKTLQLSSLSGLKSRRKLSGSMILLCIIPSLRSFTRPKISSRP